MMSQRGLVDEDGDVPRHQRNWLNSATAYMNQLGKVKTNVYTMGMTDPRALKATRSRLLSNGHTAIRIPEECEFYEYTDQEHQPASAISQRSAWGSQPSIPELMKQQSSRRCVRTRPESAKNRPKPRPGSGVKLRQRPHSAKCATGDGTVSQRSNVNMDVHISDDFEDQGESILGVTGNRYSHGERPDHVSYTSGHVGYVAPPSTRAPQTEEEIKQTISQFIGAQNPGISIPSAPRSSPDLQDPADNSENGSQEAPPPPTQQLNLCMTLPNPENEDFDPDAAPQQPHIHYTDLPSNHLSNQADHRNERDIQNDTSDAYITNAVPNNSSFSTHYDAGLNDFPNKMSEFDLRRQISDLHDEIEDIQNKIELSERTTMPSDILNNQAQRSSMKKQRPQSAKSSVRIDEGENMTIDITPRERSQKYRPGSGRRDLRYVKSRIDSGIKMYPARPPDKPKPSRPRPNSGTYTVETAKEALAANQNAPPFPSSPETANQARPPRPSSAKMATLNVEYLYDDSQVSHDVPPSAINNSFHHHSAKPPSGAKSKPEVVTMMSQMNFIKNETDLNSEKGNEFNKSVHGEGQNNNHEIQNDLNDNDKEAQRPGSPTKFLSVGEKNYYELAMSVHRKADHSQQDGSKSNSSKQVKKTTKTLEMADNREMSENKSVSVIGAQEYECKDFVAPRPTSAKRPRSPAVKPETLTEEKPKEIPVNATKPTHDAQGRRIGRPPSGRKPPKPAVVSEAIKVTDSEVWLENNDPCENEAEMEARPGSRMGFYVQQVSSNKENRLDFSSLPAEKADSNKSSVTKRTGLRNRPHSAHVISGCGHNHNMAGKGAKQDSVSYMFAGEKNFERNAEFSTAQKDYRKIDKKYGKKNYGSDVIEIWTRKEDFEFETEGVKECRDIQDKLKENGIPVDLKTLTRALLPPTEYGWTGPSYKSNMEPSRRPFSSNLLSKPQTWLPAEYKKLKEAEKKVQEATLQLQAQRKREERLNSASSSGTHTSGKGKRKSKAGKKKKEKSTDCDLR